MGTSLDTNERGPVTPTLKLAEIGQFIDCMAVDCEVVPAYVYGTNEQATTKNGKPKTQDKLTVRVVKGTGLITALDDEGKVIAGPDGKATYREVREGDVGVIYIEGPNRWDPDMDDTREKHAAKSFSGAKDDADGLQVGDVIRWNYERDKPGAGVQPRKIRLFRIRRNKPEEQVLADECERIRKERRTVQLQPAGAPAGGGHVYQDDEPF